MLMLMLVHCALTNVNRYNFYLENVFVNVDIKIELILIYAVKESFMLNNVAFHYKVDA